MVGKLSRRKLLVQSFMVRYCTAAGSPRALISGWSVSCITPGKWLQVQWWRSGNMISRKSQVSPTIVAAFTRSSSPTIICVCKPPPEAPATPIRLRSTSASDSSRSSARRLFQTMSVWCEMPT